MCLLRLYDLLAAQLSFSALPNELVSGILRRAWADRPLSPAAKEVRAAAGLACVCRRVRALLRAQPLPLALDFSMARMSAAQRSWLLEPAQAGRVEAASFHIEDTLWEQPLLDAFLALHGGTLLQLSGVPLRLVACACQEQRPALDLSGLRLTKLGIDCYEIDDLVCTDDNTGAKCLWLWPKSLPGALEELELLSMDSVWLEELAWAPRSGAGLAGRLPRLHTLRMTRVRGRAPDFTEEVLHLEGYPVLPAFEVETLDAAVEIHNNLFGQVGYLRVVAGGRMLLRGHQENVAAFVDSLCPVGLQAAELCAEDCIAHGDRVFFLEIIVRELISRHGDGFAVEVGNLEKNCDEDDGYWGHARLRRLAWRRWPALGATGLQAARAAHEHACAWAVECGQQQLQQ